MTPSSGGLEQAGRKGVPTETVLVTAAVTAAFVLFGLVLAYVSRTAG